MVSMTPFVANAAFICWFALNCIDAGNQLQIITNTMNIIKNYDPDVKRKC